MIIKLLKGISFTLLALAVCSCNSIPATMLAVENQNLPENTLLLDDVTLTINGGNNIIANNNFSKGLVHWSTWNDDKNSFSLINKYDYNSKKFSYVFCNANGASRTFYTVEEKYYNWDRNEVDPYNSKFPIWISVVQNDKISFSFWYKYNLGNAYILGIDKNGKWSNLLHINGQKTNIWQQITSNIIINQDILGIGIQFDYIP
jgi:hypothetical protein